MSPLPPTILDTIGFVQNFLAEYYGSVLPVDARHHVMTPPSPVQRGKTLVFAEEEEVFIGVCFSDEIIHDLEQRRPLDLGLTLHNLDSFCVLVEEISHFHLIAQRASQDRKTSVLELEFQAEIDKFLLASHVLQQQSGKTHASALLRVLVDQAKIVPGAQEHVYHEATKWAGRLLWQLQGHVSPTARIMENSEIRKLLQNIFVKNWAEKISFLAGQSRQIA